MENLGIKSDFRDTQKSTKDEYAIIFKRLLKKYETPEDIATYLKTLKSVSYWRKQRASIIYICASILRKSIDHEGLPECKPKVASYNIDLLNLILDLSPIAPEQRIAKHSKKSDLKHLPDNWRQEIINRMPKYKLQVITLALTGCRPEELKKGVKWELSNNQLIATIKGAKVKELSGQPERKLTFEISGDIAFQMAEYLGTQSEISIITVLDKSALTDAISSAGRRAFKSKSVKSVSAYSFRHQFAADGKADCMTRPDPEAALIDLSAALGHLSSATKGFYGNFRQARGGGAKLLRVEASRQVKLKVKTNFVNSKSFKPN